MHFNRGKLKRESRLSKSEGSYKCLNQKMLIPTCVTTQTKAKSIDSCQQTKTLVTGASARGFGVSR